MSDRIYHICRFWNIKNFYHFIFCCIRNVGGNYNFFHFYFIQHPLPKLSPNLTFRVSLIVYEIVIYRLKFETLHITVYSWHFCEDFKASFLSLPLWSRWHFKNIIVATSPPILDNYEINVPFGISVVSTDDEHVA